MPPSGGFNTGNTSGNAPSKMRGDATCATMACPLAGDAVGSTSMAADLEMLVRSQLVPVSGTPEFKFVVRSLRKMCMEGWGIIISQEGGVGSGGGKGMGTGGGRKGEIRFVLQKIRFVPQQSHINLLIIINNMS